MLTVGQVAKVCEVRPSTVRSWISRGHVTRNDRGLIEGADLLRWWDETRRHDKVTRTVRPVCNTGH